MRIDKFASFRAEKDPDRFGYVYITLNSVNEKIYIGQHRLCSQCRSGQCNYLGSGVVFLRALQKHGRDKFLSICIANCYSQRELDLEEQKFIEYFSNNDENLYNILKTIIIDSGAGISSRGTAKLAENTHRERWESLGLIEDSLAKLSDQVLVELHNEGYSNFSIGRKYDVNCNIVKRRMFALNLPCAPRPLGEGNQRNTIVCDLNHLKKKKTFPEFSDEELMNLISLETVRQLHTVDRLSDGEAANYLRISKRNFSRLRKIYNIKRITSRNRRTDAEWVALASKEKLIEIYIEQNHTSEQSMKILGLNKKTFWRLLKRYDITKPRELVCKTVIKNPEADYLTKLARRIDLDKIIKLHSRGYTVARIAKTLELDRGTIVRFLSLKKLSENPRFFESCYDQIERVLSSQNVKELLIQHNGRVRPAAKSINLSAATLYKLVDFYNTKDESV